MLVDIMYKDLSTLKILSKNRKAAGLRRATGFILLIPSAICLIASPVAGIVGSVLALELLKGKKINLKKSWTLKEVRIFNEKRSASNLRN